MEYLGKNGTVVLLCFVGYDEDMMGII